MDTDDGMDKLHEIMSNPLSDTVNMITSLVTCQRSGDLAALDLLVSEILFGTRKPEPGASWLMKWRWRRWCKQQARAGQLLWALTLLLSSTRALAAFAEENGLSVQMLGFYVEALDQQAGRKS